MPTTHQLYAGPALPPEQVAVVRDSGNVWVLVVDGRKIVESVTDRIEHTFYLTPGPHRLEVYYTDRSIYTGAGWYTPNLITIRHDFEAGHVYGFAAKRERVNRDSARVNVALFDRTTGKSVAEPSVGPEPPTFVEGQTGATLVGIANDGFENVTGREVWLTEDTPAARGWVNLINSDNRLTWDREKTRPRSVKLRTTLGYGAGYFEFVDVPPGKYLVIAPLTWEVLATAIEVREGQCVVPAVRVDSVPPKEWWKEKR